MSELISRKEAAEILGIDSDDLTPYAKRHGLNFTIKNGVEHYKLEAVTAVAEKLAKKRDVVVFDTLTPDMMTSLEVMEVWGCSSQNLLKRYKAASVMPLGFYKAKRRVLVFSRAEVLAAVPGLEQRRAIWGTEQQKKKPTPLAKAFLKNKAAYIEAHNRRLKNV